MQIFAKRTTSMPRRAWRTSILTFFLAPFGLVLMATGILFLWENPWLLKWLWWPIPLCWILGYGLHRMGKNRFGGIWKPESEDLDRWTPQDKQAWEKVTAHADQAHALTTDELLSIETYLNSTRQLAETLAAHYHPGAKNAVDALTLPEVLTAAELAISDLGRFVRRYVPGSHLITIRYFRQAPKVSDRWNHWKPLYRAASVLWSPWSALTRVAADGTVMTPVMQEFKKEGMASVYRAFVLQAGKYLIELNSHRLKVGPDRWRQLTGTSLDQSHPADRAAPHRDSPPEPAETLQIVVVGQVNAGKSSLINAMIGHQRAAVDVLPLTETMQAYTLHQQESEHAIVLLDTIGFEHKGPQVDQWEMTMRAVRKSAMMILVMNACEPAREPDCSFLRELHQWFATRPKSRRPPVLVVLTHIDLLAPGMEWEPPYSSWVRPKPKRLKEQNIREVIKDVQTLFGRDVDGIVPACTDMDKGRVYGLKEWVIPAFLNLLPQAQAKQLIDVLFAERDQHRLSRLLAQIWNASSTLAMYQFCGSDSVLPHPPGGDREPEIPLD